jgi:predicted RecB family endonuclease
VKTEAQAEEILSTLLREAGLTIRRQVRLGAKQVDVVAEGASGLWAIEVKLRDWRRGMGQAYLNAAYVDRSYLAMPANVRRRLDEDALAELGVGLIEFSETGWVERFPPRVRDRREARLSV